MTASPKLSIAIPCHNEDLVISELYRRVTAACQACAGSDYEIVLVNDGSTDQTWNKIAELCASDSHIVGVDLSRNFGHQLALSAGLEICKGERILILDADLQDPPELLQIMMIEIDKGADVAYGKRTSREGETFLKKKTASAFYKILRQLTNVDIPLDTGDFRLITRRVRDHLVSMPESQRFIRGMVAWLGYKQVPVPYARKERFAGQTKYPFRKMISFALDAITSFSTSPIRLSVYFSGIFALISCALIGYVLLSWLAFDAIPGWASLGLIITATSAGQFFILGMIGEYVGRIYIESKNRPLYLINTILTQEEARK